MNFSGQAGGDAVDVDFASPSPFRFEEELMPILVGEPHDFVFDRRTVAWAPGADLTRVHRGSVEVGSDQFVRAFVGVSDMTGELFDVQSTGEERERLRWVVSRLQLGLGIVDRRAVQPWRRAGLESSGFESEFLEGAADALSGAFSGSSSRDLLFTCMHDGGQEGAGREDDAASPIANVTPRCDSNAASFLVMAFDEESFDDFLAKSEVGCFVQQVSDFELVGLLVGLGSRPVHGGAFPPIEDSELNSGGIDGSAHQAIESIDLADELAFTDTTDRRIAAHLADGIEVRRKQERAGTEASCCRSRLGAGVTSADDNHVVVTTLDCHGPSYPAEFWSIAREIR